MSVSAAVDWFQVVSAPPDAEPPSPGALAWLWCRCCGIWFLPIDDGDDLPDLLALVADHQVDCDWDSNPEPPDVCSPVDEPGAGDTVGP